MLEGDPLFTHAHCFCGNNEFLFAFRKHLAAYHAGEPCPGKQPEYYHYDEYLCVFVDRLLCEDVGKHHRKGQEGYRGENLRHAHEHHIHPSAEVAGKAADDNGDYGGNDNGDRADSHCHLTAVDYTGERISAVAVSTERVAGKTCTAEQLTVFINGICLISAGINLGGRHAVHIALTVEVRAPGVNPAGFADSHNVLRAARDRNYLFAFHRIGNFILAAFGGAGDKHLPILHQEHKAVLGCGYIHDLVLFKILGKLDSFAVFGDLDRAEISARAFYRTVAHQCEGIVVGKADLFHSLGKLVHGFFVVFEVFAGVLVAPDISLAVDNKRGCLIPAFERLHLACIDSVVYKLRGHFGNIVVFRIALISAVLAEIAVAPADNTPVCRDGDNMVAPGCGGDNIALFNLFGKFGIIELGKRILCAAPDIKRVVVAHAQCKIGIAVDAFDVILHAGGYTAHRHCRRDVRLVRIGEGKLHREKQRPDEHEHEQQHKHHKCHNGKLAPEKCFYGKLGRAFELLDGKNVIPGKLLARAAEHTLYPAPQCFEYGGAAFFFAGIFISH